MKSVKYKLRIKGLETPDGKISVRLLLEVLQNLTDCAERGLRLAVEGTSVKSGRPPTWLEQAVNLTFSGVKKGSTVLEFEAPLLGDAIGSQLNQKDFWIVQPTKDDTALSLFSKSVRDMTAENLESDYYDAGVLRGLLSLKPFLKKATSVELSAAGRPQDHVTLTMAEMEKAERLKVRTPEPQACIVSGHLDAIQHRKKCFQLILSEGQSILGRIDEEFISAENLREFWGKDVTIKGMVHFKPSGRMQLLDAQLIKHKEAGEEVFQEMPMVQSEAVFVTNAFQNHDRKNWLKEIWNQWPGDEPVEDLLHDLKS
jgi:hypothetical protein